MITQSDLLRVSEKRILVGRAIEDDDPEYIGHARDLLRTELEHLVRLVHDEIQSLRPAPHPMPESQALDLGWYQNLADIWGHTILVLDRVQGVIHDHAPGMKYLVNESAATEWEKMNALARVEPKNLPVASEGV